MRLAAAAWHTLRVRRLLAADVAGGMVSGLEPPSEDDPAPVEPAAPDEVETT